MPWRSRKRQRDARGGPLEDKPLVKKRKRKVKVAKETVPSAEECPVVSGDEQEVMGMEEWEWLGVPAPLIKGLHRLGFKVPTPIQKQAIARTMKTKGDVIGAAETGSGKTLAFGIPVLIDILKNTESQTVTRTKNSNPFPKAKGKGRSKGGKAKVEEEDVVDLNVVLDSIESESDYEVVDEYVMDGDAKVGVVSEEEAEMGVVSEEESEVGAVSIDDGEGMVSDEESVVSGEDEEGVAKHGVGGAKLVAVRDEIPDDEFEAMLSSSKAVVRTTNLGESGIPPSMSQGSSVSRKGGGSAANSGVAGPMPPAVDPAAPCLGPVALILVPTRELAMQIHLHLTEVAKYTNIKICAVVGGMAKKKQERLLTQCPSIVVGTVGRMWMFMEEGNPHLGLDNLKYFILDEADRMIEAAHYQDMWNILDKLRGAKLHQRRRNLVYSATLMVSRRMVERKNRTKSTSRQEVMDKLMKRIGLKGDAAVVDLSGSRVVVESLTETKIMCTAETKDVFLYYFLLCYPGRTVVFVNTIKCLQRLRSMLELLQLKPLPLHATMQQRQRLKNLDRFNADGKGLLVASDVAARGLDFPKVEHIIHYQVPMNTELYVHRSGRTARALNEGLSVILVSPEDLKSYRNICRTLNKDEQLKDFPVDGDYLKPLQARVSLAKRIHTAAFRQSKVKKTESWFARSAKALDIELDDDLCATSGGGNQQAAGHLSQLRAELEALLRTTVLPRSLSRKFPTRQENHRLLEGYKDVQRKVLISTAAPKNALSAVTVKTHWQVREN